MRARTNIALKNRYTATLTDFKGVDLNTSPLRVAPNRASSMKNFICDNGILHKRPGWEEQFRIFERIEWDCGGYLPTEVHVVQKIHGVFPFYEGANEILLIHAGDGNGHGYIYRAQKTNGKWNCERLNKKDSYLDENRASCFYSDGKAYIVGCGEFLCYGRHTDSFDYTLLRAEEFGKAPVTTIGIGGSEGQSSHELVNKLTRKRINTVVGFKGEVDDGAYKTCEWEFKLDGKVGARSEVLIEGYGHIGEGENFKHYTFRLVGKCESGSGKIELKGEVLGWEGKGTFEIPDKSGIPNTFVDSTYDDFILSGYVDEDRCTIHLDFIAPPVDNEANISVTFAAVKDYDDYFAQESRFGTTFGVNGSNDRLFLAGNPHYPNMDFWSEANDFTYFPDTNKMEVGSADTAIKGYARLSDTTLAVLKEEKAGEPTIFYRTGAEKHDTANLKYDAYFPVAAGIAGDGIVNHHAGATLAGDVMVLTRSGVRALVLSSNVASGERYMHERSRPIYRELANSGELHNAAGIVYRNRYYLALPDVGKCYVADAHYKAAFDGSTDYNYEWWVWDNVHATCFAEYGDQLLFGTPDGRICTFVEGTFADRTFTELSAGNLLCNDCGGLIYNTELKPQPNDRVMLEGGVYASLATVKRNENGTIVLDDASKLADGQVVYADTVGESGLTLETPYIVDEIDVVEKTFTLYQVIRKGASYEKGSAVSLKGVDFRLLEKLDGEELFVALSDQDGDGVYDEGLNKHDDEKQDFFVARGYNVDEDGKKIWNKIFLTTYNKATATWTGRYVHVSPVRAEWVTPVMDFGTNASAKTLLGITVATEPGIGGLVTFGYETRRQLGSMAVPVGGDGFDFSGLDFNNFSFDASFACSYTRRMNLRNFNFIVFRFGSDVDRDCAVSGVTLQYKINRKNLGVR